MKKKCLSYLSHANLTKEVSNEHFIIIAKGVIISLNCMPIDNNKEGNRTLSRYEKRSGLFTSGKLSRPLVVFGTTRHEEITS